MPRSVCNILNVVSGAILCRPFVFYLGVIMSLKEILEKMPDTSLEQLDSETKFMYGEHPHTICLFYQQIRVMITNEKERRKAAQLTE